MRKLLNLASILVIFSCSQVINAAELDPISAAGIAETEDSQIISMDLLRVTEKVTPEEVQRAKINIAKALRGELPKREPLTAVNRRNGTYCIFDGNKTYSALKEMGAKNVPVKIVEWPYTKGVKTIDELYAKNEAVESEFKSLIESLSRELGAKYVMRPGLKKRARTIEKTEKELNGNFSLICDVLAASLLFSSEEKLYEAVNKFKADNSFVMILDRWREHPRPNGYRDIQTNVMLSNGTVAEIQLHHEGIFEYSMHGGDHYLYEFERSNIDNHEMQPYTKRAEDIQRAFFKSAADGKYSSISQQVKESFKALAKELASQKTPEGADVILNRLEMIASHELNSTPAFFDNPEINILINDNYELVKQNGYAELRIPERLHNIKRENISPNVLDAAKRLHDAGFNAYIVGGVIRDSILGTKPNDYDITTDAGIDDLKNIFADTLKVHGVARGVTYYLLKYPNEIIDIAIMRNVPAAFHRLKKVPEFDPESLFSKNLLFDALERDLTFNAVYYDLNTGDIIDFLGGLHDLREKIIVTPVEPDINLTNDSRIFIRALRFKAQYGFRFSDELERAARNNYMKYMKLLAPSELAFNFNKLFCTGYARKSYEVLRDYKVFECVFPSVKDICGTEKYINYAERASDFLDNKYKSGEEIHNSLVIALMLKPALEYHDVKTILDEQSSVYEFSKGERERIEKLLTSQEQLEPVAGF